MIGGYLSWTQMNQCYNCIHCFIIKAPYNLWSASIRHWPDTFLSDQYLMNFDLGHNWHIVSMYPHIIACDGCLYPLYTLHSLIARFMGPTWGPSRADRTQVGPMNFVIWVPLPQIPSQLHSFILLDAADRDPCFHNGQCNEPVHMKYKNNMLLSVPSTSEILMSSVLLNLHWLVIYHQNLKETWYEECCNQSFGQHVCVFSLRNFVLFSIMKG